ncbi:MAG: hypothetical protein AB8G96_03380 [Phycisphaerales bacterium]
MTVATPPAPGTVFIDADARASLIASAAAAADMDAPTRARFEAGVHRVADAWGASDGDASEFDAFCRGSFLADPANRRRLLDRLERALELIHGHLYEMRRGLRWWSDTTADSVDAVDDVLATFDPAPDLSDQLYRQRIAFAALLNLDRPGPDVLLQPDLDWSADRWAEVRIARSFGPRIPADVSEHLRRTQHAANRFVSGFHVPVGRVVVPGGERPFPANRTLLAHWLIRDELRGRYGEGDGGEGGSGVAVQRTLAWIMRRHIDGTVPVQIMDGGATDEGSDWEPIANTVGGSAPDAVVGPARCEHWLAQAAAARKVDAYEREYPTLIHRRFDRDREMSADSVVALLEDLLAQPVRARLADLMRRRLGRDLEAFDIYCDEILSPGPSLDLDAKVRERFADEASFQARMADVLQDLGYTASDATFLSDRIRVEIARGSGHAMRPALPQFDAWLRTTRLPSELGWDGFDTAMHELGHAVEQVISTHFVPRPALRGVPNTACTEAFAFLYQSMARRVIGVDPAPGEPDPHDEASVATLISATQIAGPALLEISIWRWLYENPDATPEALRDRMLEVAAELWDRHYAEHFGPDPYAILAAYQHMIAHPLYLADYAMGHVIGHQVRSHVRGRDLATETRRICSIGSLTPDAWMRRAVGGPISVAALAGDAAAALDRLDAG